MNIEFLRVSAPGAALLAALLAARDALIGAESVDEIRDDGEEDLRRGEDSHTGIPGSGSNLFATNGKGVNFKASDALTTRISDRSAYSSVPLAGFKSTDDTIGISLAAGF